MPVKVILLDFDGVLVESNDIKDRAFEVVFADYPEHLPAIMDYHHRTTLIRFEKFRYVYEHILKQPYTPAVEKRLAEQFSAFCIQEVINCPWVKGAQAFLDSFVSRYPLYVVSINPSQDLEAILKGRGIRKYFKGVYTVTSSKCSAIEEILKREHALPSEAVFIGDSRSDYESAKATQVPFIGRCSGQALMADNSPVFDDMDSISKYLKAKI